MINIWQNSKSFWVKYNLKRAVQWHVWSVGCPWGTSPVLFLKYSRSLQIRIYSDLSPSSSFSESFPPAWWSWIDSGVRNWGKSYPMAFTLTRYHLSEHSEKYSTNIKTQTDYKYLARLVNVLQVQLLVYAMVHWSWFGSSWLNTDFLPPYYAII